jgi:hypothetical protein
MNGMQLRAGYKCDFVCDFMFDLMFDLITDAILCPRRSHDRLHVLSPLGGMGGEVGNSRYRSRRLCGPPSPTAVEGKIRGSTVK